MKVLKTEKILSFLKFYEQLHDDGENTASIDIASLRKWIDIESLDAIEVAKLAEVEERNNKVLGIA